MRLSGCAYAYMCLTAVEHERIGEMFSQQRNPVVEGQEAGQNEVWPERVQAVRATTLGVLVGLLGGGGLAWLAIHGYFTPGGDRASWYLTRSMATVAYLLLSAATIWGLLLSTKLVKGWIPAPLALAMHSALSWLAVGLGAGHALLLLADTYYHYTLADLLIPFTGPYEPLWVGAGTLALYGLALVSASFWVRGRLGTTWWRRLHYSTFAFYVLATAHAFMAGSDSGKLQMQMMYAVSALLVLFLTNMRWIGVMMARKEQTQRPSQA